jgi:PKD repeat protein
MINDTVSVVAAVTDPSASDSLSCALNWGDGSTSSGTLEEGFCKASRTYTAAGVYTIQMTVTDDDTGSAAKSVMVVVYDPSAGFVTGGGWIYSPAGAYKLDGSLAGKATFGFVSRYKKGASVPEGNTEFQFEAGGFKFHSTAMNGWWSTGAGTNAQFKGSGLVNGANGSQRQCLQVHAVGWGWFPRHLPHPHLVGGWGWRARCVRQRHRPGEIGGGSIVVHTKK